MDNDYLREVWDVLAAKPDRSQLDYLTEAHLKVGHLLASADADAAEAVAVRQQEEASEWLRARENPMPGEKRISNEVCDRIAQVAVFGLKKAELAALRRAARLRNLHDTIREAMWNIRLKGAFEASTENGLPINIGGVN